MRKIPSEQLGSTRTPATVVSVKPPLQLSQSPHHAQTDSPPDRQSPNLDSPLQTYALQAATFNDNSSLLGSAWRFLVLRRNEHRGRNMVLEAPNVLLCRCCNGRVEPTNSKTSRIHHFDPGCAGLPAETKPPQSSASPDKAPGSLSKKAKRKNAPTLGKDSHGRNRRDACLFLLAVKGIYATLSGKGFLLNSSPRRSRGSPGCRLLA